MKNIRVNAWSMQSCNRLVYERMEAARHERHLDAIARTKGEIDNTPPYECTHLKNKANKKKRQEERDAEIQLQNRILLQKMLNIDTKPSQISAEMTNTQRVLPKSLNGEAHRRELDRIAYENAHLLRRLQDAQPSVDPRKWEDEEVERQALKYRLSQNSCRARPLGLRLPSKGRSPSKHSARGAPFAQVLPAVGGPLTSRIDAEWHRLTKEDINKQLLDVQPDGHAP
eukprot:gnl/TRDRNA2_/TRDRNA2_68718_c0_seq1.p1 gnl/TRDRNA2_/TRDRNA2_68718_c0~~gnl/TRDRNA2_/TRDRNA2_68718_c0_seq1.p1  ORF type:complete len:227 (+),score=51.89 gnl/TRDRNA2_/TRDRNA2_68718_c0_seq1:71-751(+)